MINGHYFNLTTPILVYFLSTTQGRLDSNVDLAMGIVITVKGRLNQEEMYNHMT